MSNANITVEVREVYGNPTVYPVCEKAKQLADLAGTKTLTRQTLQKIEALGFVVNVKQKTLDLKSIGMGR